ncbi:MAG: hypothetical protein U1E45_02370 [Geminicoccaceae bacterium]
MGQDEAAKGGVGAGAVDGGDPALTLRIDSDAPAVIVGVTLQGDVRDERQFAPGQLQGTAF